MELIQTNRFKRVYKKLPSNVLKDVNAAIHSIMKNPEIGVRKKGDLDWLRVYKFKSLGQLYLLGYSYTVGELTLTLIAIGSHENFYRDLK
jgi:hypothetical protein